MCKYLSLLSRSTDISGNYSVMSISRNAYNASDDNFAKNLLHLFDAFWFQFYIATARIVSESNDTLFLILLNVLYY